MPPEFTSDSSMESPDTPLEDNNPSTKTDKGKGSRENKYQCSIGECKESFRRQDQLDRHEYKHTGIKKHPCQYEGCNKIYSILTHLKRHVRTTHEKAEKIMSGELSTTTFLKTIKCEWSGSSGEDCGKLFTNMTNMRRHMREVHENPKILKCLHCELTFKHKLKLKRHEIQQHTHSYPFDCTKCKRGFYQKWQLEKHVCADRKHYQCTQCKDVFERWSLYMKHCKELQHGRQYHLCEYCQQRYSRPSELQLHIKMKHSSSGEKDGDRREPSYPCPYDDCSKVYNYEKNLKQHIHSKHEGKRFRCSQNDCDKSFTTVQNLHKHLMRDHPQQEKVTEAVNGEGTMQNLSLGRNSRDKPRKKRKDAGIPKVSTLAMLCGLKVDRDTDKKLRSREAAALDQVTESLRFCLQMEIN